MASAAAQIFRRHHRHGSGAELHIRLIDAEFRAVLGRVLADSDPDHAGGRLLRIESKILGPQERRLPSLQPFLRLLPGKIPL